MICPSCNQIIADGSSICPMCGAQIPQSNTSYNGSMSEMYRDAERNRFNNQMNNQMNIQATQIPNAPEYNLWLAISIGLIVAGCCCCCGGGITVPITGILMLIFTILGNSAFKSNNYVNYRKYFKYAKITLIAGAVLICINIIISIVSGLGSMLYDSIRYM